MMNKALMRVTILGLAAVMLLVVVGALTQPTIAQEIEDDDEECVVYVADLTAEPAEADDGEDMDEVGVDDETGGVDDDNDQAGDVDDDETGDVDDDDDQAGDDVDAAGDVDEADEGDDSCGLLDDATLTIEDVIAVAEDEIDSTVIFIELERENSQLVFEAELEDGSEIEIDAESGEILEIE